MDDPADCMHVGLKSISRTNIVEETEELSGNKIIGFLERMKQLGSCHSQETNYRIFRELSRIFFYRILGSCQETKF